MCVMLVYKIVFPNMEKSALSVVPWETFRLQTIFINVNLYWTTVAT